MAACAASTNAERSQGLLEEAGVEADFGDIKDTFFEDLDFELLYANAFDRIEQANVAQEIGIVYLAFDE
jgi:hypothetical protein